MIEKRYFEDCYYWHVDKRDQCSKWIPRSIYLIIVWGLHSFLVLYHFQVSSQHLKVLVGVLLFAVAKVITDYILMLYHQNRIEHYDYVNKQMHEVIKDSQGEIKQL